MTGRALGLRPLLLVAGLAYLLATFFFMREGAREPASVPVAVASID